jgi:hypothetical protein
MMIHLPTTASRLTSRMMIFRSNRLSLYS